MSRLNRVVLATLLAFSAEALATAVPVAAQDRARAEVARPTAGPDALLDGELAAANAEMQARQLEMIAAHAELQLSQADLEVASPELAALVLPAIRGRHERFATVPPLPLQQGDSAEQLYKLAREHLNQGDYRQAAALFRSLVDRYPRSKYAPDALYWQAFALYRRGGQDRLRQALKSLDEQQAQFPNAATRGDADALAVRIKGELARGGDTEAAQEIAQEAAQIAANALEAARPAIEMASRIAAEQVGPAVDKAMQQANEALRHANVDLAGIGDTRLPPECAGQQEKIEMRIAALNALLQMQSEQALPILKDVLKRRDVCSAPLRRKAVFLVAQEHQQSAETEDILLDVVRNDPDRGVREQAVFWLSQVPGERSTKALEEVLTSSTDPKLQERALFALSQHNSPEATAILRRYAADAKASEELRRQAIFGLSQRHDQRQNAEFLEQLYRQTSNPELKRQILFSLSQLGGEGTDRFLMDVVRDPSQPIDARKQALLQATQSGRLSTASLAELYDSPVDKDLKEPIIFALGQRPDGIDKLIDIARNEKNPGFRQRAIFWLGQSRDPRAAKVLQEIISQ